MCPCSIATNASSSLSSLSVLNIFLHVRLDIIVSVGSSTNLFRTECTGTSTASSTHLVSVSSSIPAQPPMREPEQAPVAGSSDPSCGQSQYPSLIQSFGIVTFFPAAAPVPYPRTHSSDSTWTVCWTTTTNSTNVTTGRDGIRGRDGKETTGLAAIIVDRETAPLDGSHATTALASLALPCLGFVSFCFVSFVGWWVDSVLCRHNGLFPNLPIVSIFDENPSNQKRKRSVLVCTRACVCVCNDREEQQAPAIWKEPVCN